MKGMVPPDPLTQVSKEQFAVIYVPRRNRKRFSANCVTIFPTQQEAINASSPDKKYYPAIVLGPSKSSEGQYIYYLIKLL